MKKQILSVLLCSAIGLGSFAQCLTINCPSPISVNNDPGICGATVTYNLPAMNSTCMGAINDTFFYTGAMQTYVVPAGVTTLTLETWGAQGGANWVNNVNFGGYAKADFSVTPGETLYIFAGQQPNGITGGFNGGGNGEAAGQGGGGASDVRQGGMTLNDRIIVAGGGGGAGYWSNLHVVGGVGGGSTGGDGYRDPSYASNPGGRGGTQTAGGADGTCASLNNTICAGGFGFGGIPVSCGCEGYGGGGGWYGGAGSGNCRGGGGGSGYILPLASNPTVSSGVRVGHGKVVVSYNGPATPSLTQTAGLASGSIFPVGTTTNTFMASDAFGNSANCSFNVVVTDNEAPVIAGLNSVITAVNNPGQCGATVTWNAPTITDNCSGSITTTQTANSGDFFPVGNTTVTYTSDDGVNSASVSFTITVVDNEAPVLSACPPDINMCPGNVILGNMPTATDNCTTTVSQISGPNNGDALTAGTYTVQYVAIDPSGNTDTCGFTIVVNANPVVTLNLGPQSFVCLSDASFMMAGESPAGGSWSGPGVTGSSFDPTTAGVGFQPILYTYTDTNGCVATAIDTIQVDVCTGISMEGIQTFRMFPNPATGSFWFSTVTKGTLEIVDVNGRVVKTEMIVLNKQEINLNGISPATYTVRFISENGKTSSGQLLIQK
ncbi:hypothetical protein BH09BAC5_BH09BAC5_12970 [soil metagenome]